MPSFYSIFYSIMPFSYSRLLRCLLPVFVSLSAFLPARAAPLTVPAQYATIQAAINASVNGDTVLIADGTYTGPGNVDLDFNGRNITVTSQNGAAKTIIDCGGTASSNHRGFYLHSSETQAVISGLTIQNGYEYGSGGGIFASGVGVTIQNCMLTGNTAVYGGGLYISNGSATVAVTNSGFIGNKANSYGLGGGLCSDSGSGTTTVTSCTFIANSADAGGGGLSSASYSQGTGKCVLTNDIFYNDSHGEIAGGSVTTSYCDIQGGYPGIGNLNADPLFVSAPSDLHLQSGSPCLNAGTASGTPATTLDGRTRPNPPSIGAYELNNVRAVPSQYGFIQSAIDASVNGDTVLIADGTYTGLGNIDLDFGGKNITIISQNGAARTIIDCQGSANDNHRGFYVHSGETSAVISGLTIQNGYEGGNGGGGRGGGIFKSGAGLTVQNCILKNNTTAYGYGGGIYNDSDSSPTVPNGPLTVTNCVFVGNNGGYEGGGIYNKYYNSGLLRVTNCTFTGNSAGQGGGISNPGYPGSGVTTFLINDIFYGDYGGGEFAGDPASVAAVNCDFQYGFPGTNNISTDPLFFSAPGDLHLLASSPCLGAGTTNGSPLTTIDKQSRPIPPSIGAYEIVSTGTAATMAALSSSLNPSVVGQSVTFTARLSGTGGTPMGIVIFTIDGTMQPPITLSGGAASYTTSALTGGSHFIEANYGGDTVFASHNFQPLTQMVNGSSTTTTLTSSLNPSTYGQQAILTATVTGNNPTGDVTFTDTVSGTTLGTGTVSGGEATFSVAALAAGSYRITASYSGDNNNSGSVSAPLAQTIRVSATTTSLISALNPSFSGQYIYFLAPVGGTGGGSASGTITFTVDGTVGTPMPFSQHGIASFGTSALSVGSHTLTAAYSGDANCLPSTSPPLVQVVKAHINTPQYVSPSGNDSNPGTQAAPKRTIQAAINATLSGDTVIIGDGTYTGVGNVDLELGGRNITVTSQNGAAKTIIDCQGSANVNHRGFYLHNGEASAVISGLTIQNGYESGGNSHGGGISNFSVGVNIQNCLLKNNTADYGGGIFNDNENSNSVKVTNCAFIGNSATYCGGGIYSYNSSGCIVEITNCTFVYNASQSQGGGIFNGNSAGGTTVVTNCTLSGNTADYAGGGFYNNDFASAAVILTNDIVYGNTHGDLVGTSIAATYCDIQGGYTGIGNINADPLFVSATDLHLQPGSPCFGAGAASGAPATDADGRARANPPSIGAYEGTPVVKTATSISVPGQIKTQGQSITLTATLKTTGGTALGGQSVSFTVDGAAVGSATTNGSGTASLAYTIAANAAAGSHPVKAVFAGDAAHAASSGTGTLTIKYALSLSVAPVSGTAGTSVSLSAALTKTVDGGGVSGKTVTFTVDGKAAGSAVTNSSGVASRSYAIPASAASGSHPISVSFNGSADNSYTSTTGSGTLSVTSPQIATSLAVANVSGMTGQTVTLSATLTGPGGSGLSGRTVSFAVRGAAAGTATTDSSGLASLPYVLGDLVPVGTYSISASFAGDAANAASSGTGTLTVTKAVTALSVASVSGAAGQSATLTATLTGSGGTAFSGAALTFSVDGTAAGTAVTDGSGFASLPYAISSGTTLGSHTVTVTYAGDSASTAASGTGTLTVTAAKTATSVYVPNLLKPQGQAITLTATVTKTGNIGLGSLTVTFTVDGVAVGTAVTSSAGTASLPYTIAANAAAGAHSVKAVFAGDATHTASSGTGTLTVKYALTLSVPAVSGAAGTSVTLSAILTKMVDGSGVSSKTITFTVDGKAVGAASTNSSGVASLSYAIPAGAAVGSHSVGAAFNGASDATYTSTTGSSTLTVH